MSTISNTPGSNQPRKRRGLLIGGIALAAVLAVGVTVAVVASQGGDDAPSEAAGYDLVNDDVVDEGGQVDAGRDPFVQDRAAI